MNKDIDFPEVNQICAKHQIEIKVLEAVTGSFYKKIFFINQELLLRMSETSMTLEQEKFWRIAELKHVPKILHVGVLERDTGPVYYTILTLLPGDDFVDSYPMITLAQQEQLGQEVAVFLDNLQGITGEHYDIGMYLPAVPHFTGTWSTGHRKYWEILEQESMEMDLQPESIKVLESAFRFLRASIHVLDFQTGPKLLHNDFHPRNMLLYQGKFSGVIDWECSQFGEADFELCHLIHWCLYPPEPNLNYRPFLRALFQSAPQCTQVPNLARRLTIYQIEHEIHQIIWHGSKAESWRVPRLVNWMDGSVDYLFREITVLEKNTT